MCDNWQETAQMFSSLFEKPKMSEKLLCKPPFKYLFDIFKETQKATGYGKGLLNEQEQDSAYYDNRDKKVEYLKKLIDLTSLSLKQEFQAKPTKIVAGLEPQHTNTFLQGLYKAAMSVENSAPYVKKVLQMHGGGGDEPQEQEQEKPKPKPKPQPKQEEQEEVTIKQTAKPKKVVVEDQRKPQRPPKQEPKQQQNEDDENLGVETQQQPQKEHKQVHNKAFAQDGGLDEEDLRENKQPQQQEESKGTGIKMKKRLGAKSKPAEDTQQRGSSEQGQTSVIQMSRKAENIEDVEYLSKIVQQICQSANPLGKSLEFINDDIESMNNELKHWNQQYQGYKDKMARELRITEETLSPLQDKLTEIELSIADEKAKIQNMKSQILKNQYTINTLLHSVVATK